MKTLHWYTFTFKDGSKIRVEGYSTQDALDKAVSIKENGV